MMTGAPRPQLVSSLSACYGMCCVLLVCVRTILPASTAGPDEHEVLIAGRRYCCSRRPQATIVYPSSVASVRHARADARPPQTHGPDLAHGPCWPASTESRGLHSCESLSADLQVAIFRSVRLQRIPLSL